MRDKTAPLVLAVVALVGLGCEELTPIVSAVPDDPTFRPERIDFGLVPLGRTSTDTVVVTNPNAGSVFLTSLRVEGEDRASFEVDSTEIEIEGARTRQVQVSFRPLRLGSVRADLEIFHSEASVPAIVTLVGTGTTAGPTPCVDEDGDGHVAGCEAATDCDDTDPQSFPGAEERCDGKNNDCDDEIDEGLFAPRYVDADGDGWGVGTATVVPICPEPAGHAARGGDCRDDLPDVHPEAAELCDGVDNDCNGVEDDGLPRTTYFADLDSDQYGDAGSSTVACAAPAGYVAQAGDCDDRRPDVNPLQVEICDGVDNDCSGVEDDGLPRATFYLDFDGDGYGDAATATVACAAPAGYVFEGTDCDDQVAAANPGAAEICSGGVDEDCDRLVDALDPDCQCTTQDQCLPSTNGQVCPRTGAPALACRPLCRDPDDCVLGEACRPLPGSAGLGWCEPNAGLVPENGACASTADCDTGVCFGGVCKRVCQAQVDCGAGDVCGIAVYDTAEIGGAVQTRQTMLCQPLLGREPIGTGTCQISATNADTGQCATTHCDWEQWRFGYSSTPYCAPLCSGSDDCGPNQVCGVVFNSTLESPPIPSTQEAAGRFHDAILGCYTPHTPTGLPVPRGVGALGAPCTAATARTACRSHQCAQFAPIANRCTDFCDEDSDCVSPSTPNWRCQVGELNFTSLFLQSAGVADPSKFTLVGICAP